MSTERAASTSIANITITTSAADLTAEDLEKLFAQFSHLPKENTTVAASKQRKQHEPNNYSVLLEAIASLAAKDDSFRQDLIILARELNDDIHDDESDNGYPAIVDSSGESDNGSDDADGEYISDSETDIVDKLSDCDTIESLIHFALDHEERKEIRKSYREGTLPPSFIEELKREYYGDAENDDNYFSEEELLIEQENEEQTIRAMLNDAEVDYEDVPSFQEDGGNIIIDGEIESTVIYDEDHARLEQVGA